MNSLNIKQMLIGIVVCFFCLQGYATSIDETNRYKKRVEGYRSMWESLMPTYTKLQYAGGMGLINTGFGWSYGKNNQWETDILFGIIPKYSSDNAKMTFTLKQNYIPWRKKLNDSFTFEPLECGLYFNTVFSDEFWTKEIYVQSYEEKISFLLYFGKLYKSWKLTNRILNSFTPCILQDAAIQSQYI